MAESENPFESPSPKGTRIVQATLRVVVAIQCWGYAATHWHHGNDYLLTNMIASSYEIEVEQVPLINQYTVYFLIGCGLLVLFRPMWITLIPLIAWQIGMAIAPVISNTGTIPALEPAEQATRFTLPIALLLMDFWPPKVKPTLAFCMSSIGLLRIATAATFIGHGLMALYQFQKGGNFVELIQLSFANVFQRDVPTELAQQVLAVIGAIDIAAAISLISSRNRLMASWMVLWGLITAFSRTLAYGFDGYDQTLIRVANAGAPLTVLVFWLTAVREQKPIILPEEDS